MAALLTLINLLTTLCGALTLLYSVWMSITANFNTGNVMVFAFGLTLLLWFRLKKNLFFLIVKTIALIGFCAVFFIMGIIYQGSVADRSTGKEDALIVLGCAVIGENVSKPLKYRLDAACKWHEENPSGLIVVSGGKGPQEDITEAFAMKKYLLAAGVDENVIITEEKATSTDENFKFSKEILDEYFKRDYSVAFATNDFHCYRARLLGKKYFEDIKSLSAPINLSAAPVCWFRETAAVVKYWIFNN
ncbi:MAG: YdcF family protein [Firmicutes bacterium]|nr:YdcF family protein [Bacillota bacterium]